MLHDSFFKLDDAVYSADLVDKLETQTTDMSKTEKSSSNGTLRTEEIMVERIEDSKNGSENNQPSLDMIAPAENIDAKVHSSSKKVSNNDAIISTAVNSDSQQEMQEFITHEIFQFKENKLKNHSETKAPNKQKLLQKSETILESHPKFVDQTDGILASATVREKPEIKASDPLLTRRRSTSSLEISMKNQLKSQLENKIRPEIKTKSKFHGSANQIVVRDNQIPLSPSQISPKRQTWSAAASKTSNFRTPTVQDSPLVIETHKPSIFTFEEDKIISEEEIREIVRAEVRETVDLKDQEIAVLKAQLECYKQQVAHLENLTLKLFSNSK